VAAAAEKKRCVVAPPAHVVTRYEAQLGNGLRIARRVGVLRRSASVHNGIIARELFISHHAVCNDVSKNCDITGRHDRSQLIIRALKNKAFQEKHFFQEL
jgi:capsid protein